MTVFRTTGDTRVTAPRVPVCVVIPCYRSSRTIRRAVESVLSQTWLPQEIILVDDCSKDSTLEVLERIVTESADISIRVVALERNSGPGAARNQGWAAATQSYIAFLDHDDNWHPRKLEVQYGWMASHPQAVLTGHPLVQLREGASMPQIPEQLLAKPITRRDLLLSNRFPTSSVMLRRNLPFRFDTSRRYLEDYLLWLEIVLRGKPTYRLDAPLAMQHKAVFGESGLSAQLWTMEKGELNAFRRVFQEGLINFPAFLAASIGSLAKFVRRVVVSGLRPRAAATDRAGNGPAPG